MDAQSENVVVAVYQQPVSDNSGRLSYTSAPIASLPERSQSARDRALHVLAAAIASVALTLPTRCDSCGAVWQAVPSPRYRCPACGVHLNASRFFRGLEWTTEVAFR